MSDPAISLLSIASMVNGLSIILTNIFIYRKINRGGDHE